MDSDRITGAAKETFGKAEGAVGDAMGDPNIQGKGAYNEAAGAAQNLYGQAKDAVSDAAVSMKDTFGDNFSDVGASAEKALHSLEREVKNRPLIALLIAALVGYVIAQLTSN